MALAEELLAVLNDPAHMWSHALRELPRPTQRLFLTLSLLPAPAALSDLQLAYTSQEFERTETFLDSLQSLEDSFIVIGGPPSRKSRSHGRREVRFRNPSLEEFSYSYLNNYSDWLSSLLDKPAWFEQVARVFELATSHNDVAYKPREHRYPEISAWVESNSSRLLSSAIKLLSAQVDSPIYGRKNQMERLGIILEFIYRYRPALDPTDADALRLFIVEALNPSSQRSADNVLQLVENEKTRRLLDELSGIDSAMTLRANLLDKDEWKYSILLRLDECFDLKQESIASWGEDYIAYAARFVDDLSDCDHRDTLSNAIRELEDMAAYLDADFTTEIMILQAGYDELSPKDDRSYDSDYEWIDEDWESKVIEPPAGSTVGEKLDRLFESLLE